MIVGKIILLVQDIDGSMKPFTNWSTNMDGSPILKLLFKCDEITFIDDPNTIR